MLTKYKDVYKTRKLETLQHKALDDARSMLCGCLVHDCV